MTERCPVFDAMCECRRGQEAFDGEQCCTGYALQIVEGRLTDFEVGDNQVRSAAGDQVGKYTKERGTGAEDSAADDEQTGVGEVDEVGDNLGDPARPSIDEFQRNGVVGVGCIGEEVKRREMRGDMKGTDDHLASGEGTVYVAAAVEQLVAGGYTGPVAIEVSDVAAQDRSLAHLKELGAGTVTEQRWSLTVRFQEVTAPHESPRRLRPTRLPMIER